MGLLDTFRKKHRVSRSRDLGGSFEAGRSEDSEESQASLPPRAETPRAVAEPSGLRSKIRPSLPSYGVKVLYEPPAPLIDVIFLHGLTGHRDKTWTAKGSEAPWPQTLLPQDLPEARVITYGYDADVARWIGTAGRNSVREHATTLINDLVRYRARTQSHRRPLLWVAHSLGGFVLQDALVVCNNPRDESQRDILDCTRGIAFMGVPHAGSDLEKFAEAIVDIVNLSMVERANGLLIEALRSRSEILANITDDFMTIINSSSKRGHEITLQYYIEEMPIHGTDRREVTPDSAKIPGYNFDTNHADHRNMTRFTSRDESYSRLVGTLLKWANASQSLKIVEDYDHRKLSARELKIFEMLGPAIYLEQKAWISDRVPGTCQWVLNHPHFQSWYHNGIRDTDSPGFLWVSGDPGCGKSVLAKSLIDNELKLAEGNTTCYFFFKDDDVDRRSVLNALKALLHQLFTQHPSLLKYGVRALDYNGQELTKMFTILWDVLFEAAAECKGGKVVCVLDALDECEELGRARLIHVLHNLYLRDESKPELPVKFLITSRPYLDIERGFLLLGDQISVFRLSGEDDLSSIQREIDLVIAVRVKQLTWLSKPIQCSLQRALSGFSNRTYLWVTLIFDVIMDSLRITEKSLPTLLSTLPDTVEQAYESILNKSRDIPRARRLLNIVIEAQRPLTLAEMNIALNIEECYRSISDLDLQTTEEDLKSEIRNLCGLFIVVVDSRIHLIHLTAKEFLVATAKSASTRPLIDHHGSKQVSNDDDKEDSPMRWGATFSLQESNLILTEICISYMNLLSDAGGLQRSRGILPDALIGLREYAMRFWDVHYRKGSVQEGSRLAELSWSVFQRNMGPTRLHLAEPHTHRYSRLLS